MASLAKELQTERGDQALQLPSPTVQAAAYAKYISQLASNAHNLRLEHGDGAEAHLKLLAHAFSIHVAHLTTGMRVGAKAVGCLPGLTRARAVAFYRDYPSYASDPMKVFVEAVNRAGSILGSDQLLQEKVMVELPKSLGKTSLLVSELAVVEEDDAPTELRVSS